MFLKSLAQSLKEVFPVPIFLLNEVEESNDIYGVINISTETDRIKIGNIFFYSSPEERAKLESLKTKMKDEFIGNFTTIDDKYNVTIVSTTFNINLNNMALSSFNMQFTLEVVEIGKLPKLAQTKDKRIFISKEPIGTKKMREYLNNPATAIPEGVLIEILPGQFTQSPSQSTDDISPLQELFTSLNLYNKSIIYQLNVAKSAEAVKDELGALIEPVEVTLLDYTTYSNSLNSNYLIAIAEPSIVKQGKYKITLFYAYCQAVEIAAGDQELITIQMQVQNNILNFYDGIEIAKTKGDVIDYAFKLSNGDYEALAESNYSLCNGMRVFVDTKRFSEKEVFELLENKNYNPVFRELEATNMDINPIYNSNSFLQINNVFNGSSINSKNLTYSFSCLKSNQVYEDDSGNKILAPQNQINQDFFANDLKHYYIFGVAEPDELNAGKYNVSATIGIFRTNPQINGGNISINFNVETYNEPLFNMNNQTLPDNPYKNVKDKDFKIKLVTNFQSDFIDFLTNKGG